MGSSGNEMSIPDKCTVLVIGGGPGGSYTAAVLAREGIDTVLLEAEKFPRYHIGESMLPSIRHYLRFIELDEVFNKHGFTKKVGAAFKMIPHHREGFTDFIAADKNHYSWNVIRSEADELIFRHAAASGAKAVDGVKVNSIEFAKSDVDPGRPVSASYTRKDDGTTGVIKFDYVVDASGRVGVLNTKYLKNRHYNTALKNVANWAYYRGTGSYSKDPTRQNTPFFEALTDESGWAWFIPLHDGTTSVGVVRNQAIAARKKTESGLSTTEFFEDSLKFCPNLVGLISAGQRVTEVKAASDYSYHSSSYGFPYARVVGDAGCFIDPFFSSGVHLAMTGGLSAATTIAASLRGDVDEATAAQWHTSKVREGYARFLLVVLSAYKQMMNQSEPVLSDYNEDNFDRAFSFFRPVIQGTVDVSGKEVSGKLTQAEFSKTIDFLAKAFDPKIIDGSATDGAEGEARKLTEEDLEALRTIRTHHGAAVLNIDNFTTDVVDGRVPRLERGQLTLVQV
ncbi:hypothetical protein OQA88_4352 [Cercophora sp. LCS_1]